MRSLAILAILSVATALPIRNNEITKRSPSPIPQNDGGYIDGVLAEAPNTTPYINPVEPIDATNGGNDGGYVDGRPINDVSNNSKFTNPPSAPVSAPNGGNDGGYVDGKPVIESPPPPLAFLPSPGPTVGTPAYVFKKIATRSGSVSVTPEQITTVSPKSSTCDATDEFASECRTAEQAAPLITSSFDKFGITTPAEAAAVLSLMIFESDGFKYNARHFPGPNPGQGTRNMMNFPFILEYAHDVLPETEKAGLPAIDSEVDDAKKEEILKMVLGDEYSFATGAWYYHKKCDDATKQAVSTGSEDGWTQYITKCVGTTVDERQDGWNKAKQALGL